ncbi:MAG: response regulator transcription factor [Bacilli bacterium]|nr:response regulator transcription factor [Bacilli bacterium]
MRILIVEDEFNLADVILNRLKMEKYNVDISTDGEEGLYNALTGIYDLIILDVMLPKKNGYEILKEIKKEKIESKIIMLTAKTDIESKLDCFDIGINDYITKPFHIEELVARVNIQLRKTDIQSDEIIYNDLTLNTRTAVLSCNNESIEIMKKEFLLLEYFMRNPEQIISKDTLYDKIWGFDNTVESNSIEAYVSFIRKKLKVIGSKTNIKASRGLGYKLEVQDE